MRKKFKPGINVVFERLCGSLTCPDCTMENIERCQVVTDEEKISYFESELKKLTKKETVTKKGKK